jgi:hypothetical protein
MQEHQEYPKHMSHPHSRRATLEKLNPDQPDKRANWQGTPDMFPPVLVFNEDQEEEHRSRGYVTLGKSSPEAFASSSAVAAKPDYVPEEYPKWVNGVLINSADEEPDGDDSRTDNLGRAPKARRVRQQHAPNV